MTIPDPIILALSAALVIAAGALFYFLTIGWPSPL